MNTLKQLSRRVLNRIISSGALGGRRDMVSVLPRDAIASLNYPLFIQPANACQMEEHERVVGISYNGEAKAYPLNILSVHEIVNDVIAGEPVVISWSPLSFSAVVYKRTVVDRSLEFGVSGSLLRNVQVMYDRQTQSNWNQLTGDAFTGPLAGIGLQPLPAVLTTWGSWYSSYSTTTVLCKEKCPFAHYEEDHMENYYHSAETGIRKPAHNDNRLADKEIVLGVRTADSIVAYPISLLQQTKVLHDQLSEGDLAVFFEQDSASAIVYYTGVNGASLTFYEQSGQFFDYQTGSCWSPLTGTALKGPLAGKKLQQVAATTSFWFAWADHFPQTTVYFLPVLN